MHINNQQGKEKRSNMKTGTINAQWSVKNNFGNKARERLTDHQNNIGSINDAIMQRELRCLCNNS